ncbi:hypothetical protein [Hymenobacter negativus]|uniref:Uncharacterized protein n=1 Tax=Hymenobacter negativus TaxID=2795026 RepID=A0ABS3QAU4_9BACT|nr:hypothetical protein [Hymenobacter negativus]MBO2008078.1 hypothetical protein [Hymenobacter negativus]
MLNSTPLRSSRVSLVACLAGAWLVSMAAAHPATASPNPGRPALDSALTRRAYALGPELERAEWDEFSQTLRYRTQPVWAGIGNHAVGLRGRNLYCPNNLSVGERNQLGFNQWVKYKSTGYGWTPNSALMQFSHLQFDLKPRNRGHWKTTAGLRQLNNYMDDLDLERRAVEYERLSMVLREKASKMRKLEQALPVLVFTLSDNGQVVGVGVDATRTKTKLSSRSRGLLLKAVRNERFRLPARQYQVTTKKTNFQPMTVHPLEQPRPFREKLARLALGYRARQVVGGVAWVSRPVVLPLRGLLYRKTVLHGRCGETRIEWIPRFWGRH